MKTDIKSLIDSEGVLSYAQLRGTLKLNYAIGRNLKALKTSLEPFRAQFKNEPLCWLNPVQDPDAEKPSDEQIKEAEAELAKWHAMDVEFEPYHVSPDDLPDRLGLLGSAREHMTEEQLANLNDDFAVVLQVLEIVQEVD